MMRGGYLLVVAALLLHSQILPTTALPTTPPLRPSRGDSAPGSGIVVEQVTNQPVDAGTTSGIIETITSSPGASQQVASTPGPSYAVDTTPNQPQVVIPQESTQAPPTVDNNNGGLLPPGPDSPNTNNGPDNIIITTTPVPIAVAATPTPVIATNPPITVTDPPTPVYPGSGIGNQGWVHNQGQTTNPQPTNKFGALNVSPWLFYGRDVFPLLYLLQLAKQNAATQKPQPTGFNNLAPWYYSGIDLDKLLPFSYLMRNQLRSSQQQQQQQPYRASPVNNLANLYWFSEFY